jgi:hypothetical protein
MRIRYEVTFDDQMALFQYQAVRVGRTPFMRLLWSMVRWLFPVIYLGAGVVSCVLAWPSPPDGVTIFFLVIAILFSVVWLIVARDFPRFARWTNTRMLRHWEREWTENGTIGPQELELTADDLVRRNSFIEFRMRYSYVENVTTECEFTFVVTTPSPTFVIPHAGVTEGDPDEFVAALRQKIAGTPSAAG